MAEARIKRNNLISSALLLVFVLCTVFLVSSKFISDIAIDKSFDAMKSAADVYASQIKNDVEQDLSLLSSVADTIALYDDLETEAVFELLSVAQASNTFSRMELLLPNGMLYEADGTSHDVSGSLSFEKKVSRGVYISGRKYDVLDPESFVVCAGMPVERDGQAAALLVGVMVLEKRNEVYAKVFNDEATQIHVFEGESGNFIIDTTHAELLNYNMLLERDMKRGYDINEMMADFKAQRAGETAFFSSIYDEYLYSIYEPIGINDWMIMFTMRESVAFDLVTRVRRVLYVSAVLEGLAFISYFTWMLYAARHKAYESVQELGKARYMLEVEKALFDAPQNPMLFEEALGIVGRKLDAEKAFFQAYDKNGEVKMFVWRAPGYKIPEEGRLNYPLLREQISNSPGITYYDLKDLKSKSADEYKSLKRADIDSIMAIPVNLVDNEFVGALGVCNMKKMWEDAQLLECVMLSFSMAARNMETYKSVQDMGMRDQLTGLLNRNSYSMTLEEKEEETDDSLACIYIDADGLHELNNTKGHDAGDDLLKCVADGIREAFGTKDVYRIGGDEFVVFCCGYDEERLERKLMSVRRSVEKKGYHISVGVEWRHNVPVIAELVRHAEAKMYQQKRKHYKEAGIKRI